MWTYWRLIKVSALGPQKNVDSNITLIHDWKYLLSWHNIQMLWFTVSLFCVLRYFGNLVSRCTQSYVRSTMFIVFTWCSSLPCVKCQECEALHVLALHETVAFRSILVLFYDPPHRHGALWGKCSSLSCWLWWVCQSFIIWAVQHYVKQQLAIMSW